MSLVTLGSVPYNPYNDTLAQSAVSGIKLGMENLDAIEKNNQFSISETSKAFAAVTDNLLKNKELQLRSREADRMERTQAFNEFEFGEKMDYERGRAKVTDEQWLLGQRAKDREMDDNEARTRLLERNATLDEKKFSESVRQFDEGALGRLAEVQKSLMDSAWGGSPYDQTRATKLPPEKVEAISGTKTLFDQSSTQLAAAKSVFALANRYAEDDAMSADSEQAPNELETIGSGLTAEKPAAKADPNASMAGLRGQGSPLKTPLVDGILKSAQQRKPTTRAELTRLQQEITDAEEKQKMLSLHYMRLTNESEYYGSPEYKTASERIMKLFEVAEKRGNPQEEKKSKVETDTPEGT